MDVNRIEKPSEDFEEAIENAVSSCEIMIAIIGRRWLSDSNDYVRKEIAHALDREYPGDSSSGARRELARTAGVA